ncbi:hypothetical protein [Nevskia ramosa]|uniref:hypothetical protein n=1 Tax=Nevskia ramosa TaxID=64002 RepID=UPI0023522A65|nr:hypothetical protein [Nevskia ramosa]
MIASPVVAHLLRWLAIVLAALLPFWLTWRAGFNTSERAHAMQAAVATAADLTWLVDRHERNAQLAGDYVLRRAATSVRYQEIVRRIPHVVVAYREVPGAPLQPLPRCVFTGGFVRLWNDALAGGEAMPAGPGGAADATGRAGAADPESDGGR